MTTVCPGGGGSDWMTDGGVTMTSGAAVILDNENIVAAVKRLLSHDHFVLAVCVRRPRQDKPTDRVTGYPRGVVHCPTTVSQR